MLSTDKTFLTERYISRCNRDYLTAHRRHWTEVPFAVTKLSRDDDDDARWLLLSRRRRHKYITQGVAKMSLDTYVIILAPVNKGEDSFYIDMEEVENFANRIFVVKEYCAKQFKEIFGEFQEYRRTEA